MNDDQVAFVRERLAEGIENARRIGNMLITHGGPAVGVPPEVAERRARAGVEAAEVKQTLFEKTIRPYLGTAGPTGRIADEQLRLFAAMYADHPDYREEWRP
ncbi:DUF6221 family protein [Streptomyces sp. NPDC014802]|uniref:DUF6221 family protein n=1 Tax=Streptomyces sp. NPDC014802 TaxID=3364917 RepID=UPI0036FF8766